MAKIELDAEVQAGATTQLRLGRCVGLSAESVGGSGQEIRPRPKHTLVVSEMNLRKGS